MSPDPRQPPNPNDNPEPRPGPGSPWPGGGPVLGALPPPAAATPVSPPPATGRAAPQPGGQPPAPPGGGLAAPPPGAPGTLAAPAPAPTPAPAGQQTDQPSGDTARLPASGAGAVLGGQATMYGAGQASAVQQAAAGAAPAAVAAAQAAAAPQAPGGPPPGTVYNAGFSQVEDDFPARRRLRAFPRLRIGTHVANDAALGQITMADTGMGLLVGYDRDQVPATVRLFRPEPTRVTLIGGLWASQIIAFRALALGARVVVITNRPHSWEGFGQWATGRSDRVAVLPAERPVTVAASPLLPALLLYDGGLLGATERPVLGPWQTQLTVLQQLTAFGFPAVQESNLVAVQRLSEDEAIAASSVLRLPGQTTRLLQVLRDDMMALLGGGADRYVWTRPTSVEQRQFGAPQR